MKKIVLYVGAFLFSIAGYAQQALWVGRISFPPDKQR